VRHLRGCRVVAAICIAVVLFAGVLPAAATLFVAILVLLPPLFGTIVSTDAPAPESVSPQPFPPRSPLPTRAPPA
jgi:hypothetical protein